MYANDLRELLRLILTTKLSNRAIGRMRGIHYNTVRRCRKLASDKGLDLNSIETLDDAQLEMLFRSMRGPVGSKIMPDMEYIRNELQKPNMTLRLLWEEYRRNGGNYSESQHNHHVRKHLSRLDLAMRKVYVAGEWAFIDYAGSTISWIDPETGKQYEAQILVGVLGCSNYTFAYATRSQSTQDTCEAVIGFYEFCGGTCVYLGPDNFKAVVIKPGREPQFNRVFRDLARHYGVIIVPARVRRPRDKGKVEVGVQIVQRWIVARLRKRHFNSLAEINAAIQELLIWLNERPFRHLPGCRRSRFEEFDRPALKPLPAERFEYGEWTGEQKVGADYHIKVKGHYYSVHHSLVTEHVEARVNVRTVEIFHRGQRVASHRRSHVIGGQTTLPEHRPAAHRFYAEQSPELYLDWAKSVGPAVTEAVEFQLESRQRSPIALRACNTLQRFAKDYGPERLEAACRRGQEIRSLTLKSIGSILKRRLDSSSEPDVATQMPLPMHDNVRGADYYV